MAQCSAIGVSVAATPPCSAIRFCRQASLQHSDRGVARFRDGETTIKIKFTFLYGEQKVFKPIKKNHIKEFGQRKFISPASPKLDRLPSVTVTARAVCKRTSTKVATVGETETRASIVLERCCHNF